MNFALLPSPVRAPRDLLRWPFSRFVTSECHFSGSASGNVPPLSGHCAFGQNGQASEQRNMEKNPPLFFRPLSGMQKCFQTVIRPSIFRSRVLQHFLVLHTSGAICSGKRIKNKNPKKKYEILPRDRIVERQT